MTPHLLNNLAKSARKPRRCGAAFALVSLLAACTGKTDSAEKASAAAPAREIAVAVATVEQRNLPRTIQVTGSLHAYEAVTVSTEVEGIIARVYHDLGDRVSKGQLLAEVDARELALQLQRAEAALAEALAQLGIADERAPLPDEAEVAVVQQARAKRDEARLRFNRMQSLQKKGVVSQQQYDEAEVGLRVAEAQYESALETVRRLVAAVGQHRASVALARKKLDDARVLAPIAGSIEERLISAGEYVKVNQPAFRMVQTRPLKLRAEVLEKEVPVVRVGMPLHVRVDAFPGRTFEGRLTRISPTVDVQNRTFAIEGTLPNAEGLLKPGTFARITLIVGEHQAVVIPRRAVYELAGVKKAFVVSDGKIDERPVELGQELGDHVQVVSGVRAGEEVAVSNLAKLTDGLSVITKGSG